jgi:L-fuconolactonase
MAKIDAHQHFWRFEAERDTWITDEMANLRRDFLPPNLQPLLRRYNFDGSIVVQSAQSEDENEFQLSNANANTFIKGIIGWVDLQADNISEQLAYYSQFAKLKGFRHVLQGEADRALMLRPEFRRGISALSQHGFTYDLLILPDQIPFATELASAFPNQAFILDHLAKPRIREQLLDDWAHDIRTLAAKDNVSCKVSGLLTEADWQRWQPIDIQPYLDVVFNAFGSKRVMFGSDWPVCEVAGGFDKTMSLLEDYLAPFSFTEQSLFWGDNAVTFYNL